MQQFKEVSLGFAEFVSQLIQETFDAILSSQNYQLEKFQELESKLDLPNKLFAEMYLSEVEIENEIHLIYGTELKKNMVISKGLISILNELFDVPDEIISKGKLTSTGFVFLTDYAIDKIVDRHKNMLSGLLNKFNLSSLVVDSGEISAKLEMTNLFSSEVSDSQETKHIDRTNEPFVKAAHLSRNAIGSVTLPTYRRDIKVIEHKSKDSIVSTILIDKAEVENIGKTSLSIPSVRMAVQPLKASSNSNFYSEIKINFKTA